MHFYWSSHQAHVDLWKRRACTNGYSLKISVLGNKSSGYQLKGVTSQNEFEQSSGTWKGIIMKCRNLCCQTKAYVSNSVAFLIFTILFSDGSEQHDQFRYEIIKMSDEIMRTSAKIFTHLILNMNRAVNCVRLSDFYIIFSLNVEARSIAYGRFKRVLIVSWQMFCCVKLTRKKQNNVVNFLD